MRNLSRSPSARLARRLCSSSLDADAPRCAPPVNCPVSDAYRLSAWMRSSRGACLSKFRSNKRDMRLPCGTGWAPMLSLPSGGARVGSSVVGGCASPSGSSGRRSSRLEIWVSWENTNQKKKKKNFYLKRNDINVWGLERFAHTIVDMCPTR